MSDNKLEGKIKWFNREKGSGFIIERGSKGKELPVHKSNVHAVPAVIEKGQFVRFFRKEKKNGEVKAVDVTIPTRPLYQGHELDFDFPSQANLGLYFDKFFHCWMPFLGSIWPDDGDVPTPKEAWNGAGKGEWLYPFHNHSAGQSDQLREAVKRRRRLKESRDGCTLKATTTSRFVTGMGREHPVENGFAWHPTLGTPFLAGSSVKGMVRHWASEWVGDDEAVERIFGSPDEGVGSVVFLDALPTQPVKLEADVMTPHYGPWYQDKDSVNGNGEKAWPADWHNPTPIPFLTVAKGATFRFDLLPRRTEKSFEEDVELALQWLTDALEWIGAGAKTAVGYGRFAPQEQS